MRDLGIEFISVFGMDPVSYAKVVAGLGGRYLTSCLEPLEYETQYFPHYSLRDDAGLRREFAKAMQDLGLELALAEGFAVIPGKDVGAYERDLDLFAELGARRANLVSFDPDLARTRDLIAQMAQAAAARGMPASIEFLPESGIPNMQAALDVIAEVGQGLTLLVDTMHLCRSGSTPADLVALDPALIGHVQLCDVPLRSPFATYFEEAVYDRMVPGEGELPLLDILRAVPPDCVIGLEIPLRARMAAGEDAPTRLGRCVAATRDLLDRL